MCHDRHDVPVAVLSPPVDLDHGDVLAVDRHPAAGHRVHGGSVERGNVDSEVERPTSPVADARITEQSADRMLPIERLDRPRVGASAPGHDAGTLDVSSLRRNEVFSVADWASNRGRCACGRAYGPYPSLTPRR